MIDPLERAVRILRDHPDLAEPLFDLFLCAREARGTVIEADLDETQDYIYSKTPHARKTRSQYVKKRLRPVARSSPVQEELPVQ